MNGKLLILLFLLCSTGLWAQGVTTGSISGTVFSQSTKDKSRAALVGAKITALHEPTGTKYGAIVRNGGRYAIKGMRVGGPYTVRVSYIGYASAERHNITIQLGEETTVSFEMAEKEIKSEEIVITAQKNAELDASKTGAGSVITNEQITAAPTVNRNIGDFARINPYANQKGSSESGEFQAISIAGQNSRFNNIQIDGAIASDAFGLSNSGTSGGIANANFISLDAIEEMKVSVSPYDVRQSGFTGGVINAITRGGKNKSEGSVFFYGRNEDLVGLSPDKNRRPYNTFQDFQMGGRLGGKLLENTLFFHVSGEIRLRKLPLELGVNDPGALVNFPVPQSQIDDIAEIARTVYGYDAGNSNPFTRREDSYNITARLDWNINESHKLQFRHNYTHAYLDRNVRRDLRNFSLTSQWNTFFSNINSSVLQINSVFQDIDILGIKAENAHNEFRVSFTSTAERRDLQAEPFPEMRIYTGSAESVWLGPERSSATNALDLKQIALTDDFTLFLGDHTLTFGTHNELSFFNNLFIQDAFGSFIFPDVEAFRAKTPSFYAISYANTDITGGDMRPRAAWSMLQTGWYISDEWDIVDNVKIIAGLRVDVPIFFDTPYRNDTLTKRFPGFSTDRLPTNNFLFAPRIGFNYNVLDDKSLIIRGGTGIFTGRVPAVWISNQFSNTGMDILRSELGTRGANQRVIRVNDQDFIFPIDNNYANNPLVPGDSLYPGQPIRTSVINLTDQNFKLPQTWRSTLGFDHKLSNSITLTMEGMYSRNINEVTVSNMNLRPSQRLATSPIDGRPLYATARQDSLRAKEFTQVILLGNRSEGYQYSFSSQISLDSRNTYIPGLSALVSYTFGRAYDLMDGQNSTALSIWSNTDAIDPNNAQLGRSSFDIPHRIMANISYNYEWTKDIKSTIGIFYSGNSGEPYSLVYNGDINGDGFATNDLIYIPKRADYGTKIIVQKPSAGTDLRSAEQIFDQFMQFVEGNPTLNEYQGRVLPRNAMRSPWRHILDLRITQTIPSFTGDKIEFTFDIQNLLNLFNADWGWQQEVLLGSHSIVDISTTPFDNQNRLVLTNFLDPTTANSGQGIYRTDNLFSRWRMQLGMRYTF